ncbi:MAG: GntR family transcriptional regulator [Chloroflexota bacterium]
MKLFHSKKDYAYEALRENILNGTLAPGSRLVIDQLAKDFGVSPIPMREALQRLQSDGFVTIRPYSGVNVTKIHRGLVEEVLELLCPLEIVSSSKACEKMTNADFKNLRTLINTMSGEVEDIEAWSQNNIVLHHYICQWAEMSLTQSLMEQVLHRWHWLNRYYLKDQVIHYTRDDQHFHQQWFAALQTQNPLTVTDVVTKYRKDRLAIFSDYAKQSWSLQEAA